MIIRKIQPLSLAKVLSAIYAGLGLLFGALMSVASLVAPGFPGGGGGPEEWLFRGAVVLLPIVYGLFGFLGGLIVSLLYNFISRYVGGLELEVD